MLRKAGRSFIWFLIGSSIYATFIGYVLYKAGLISFQGPPPKSQRALNNDERVRNRRVGRIRVT